MTTITIDRATVEQALEALESVYGDSCDALHALRAALAQQQANPPGCDHCNHPLYAATKCRVCGRVTEPKDQAEPTYKTYPIRMKFEWVGDRWLFDGNPIESGEWCVTLGDGGWMIYPKVEQAEPAEPVYWEVRCTAHPKWMRVDKQQFDEYVAHGWEGQRLYTAPPQQAEPVKPVAWVDERAISWLASRRNKASAHITTGLSAAKTIERTVPLYTAPPQRKPLTEEEIERICMTYQSPRQAVRAVERAHGIGGQE